MKLTYFLFLFLTSGSLFGQVLLNQDAFFYSPNSTGWAMSEFDVDTLGNTYCALHKDSKFNDSIWSQGAGVILFKYNKYGQLQWMNTVGQNSTSSNQVYSFKVDANNDVWLAGYQSYNVLPEGLNPNYNMNYSHFVVKMNPSGQFLQGTRFPGKTFFSIRDNGNIAFACHLNGSGFLDEEYFSASNFMLIGEMSPQGTILWRRQLDNQFSLISVDMKLIRGINVTDDHMYIYGEHLGNYDFDGHISALGNGSINTYQEYPNMYLASFDLTTHLCDNILTTANTLIRDVETNQGELYLATDHFFHGSTNTPPSIGNLNLPYPQHDDGYLIKLNSSFNVIDTHNVGGPVDGWVSKLNDIHFHNNKVYLIGSYANWTGPASAPFETVDTLITSTKVFVSTYDLGLNYKSSHLFPFVDNGFTGAYNYRRNIRGNSDNLFICLENGNPNESPFYDGFIGVLDYSSDTLDLEDFSNTKQTIIFPNPANNELQLSFEKKVSGRISIISTEGKIIASQIPGEKNKITIDLSNLPSGIYFIKVENTIQKLLISR